MIKSAPSFIHNIGAWLASHLVIVTGLMALIGVGLRVRQYLAYRSLWRDEAALAVNIVTRSFSGLMLPLEDDQGAPLLFLWLQKALVNGLGSDEYILRLIPLLSSIISVFLLWYVASHLLTGRAVLVAVALFALSAPLIEFSTEHKQYSSDVLAGLLALVMFVALNRRQTLNWLHVVGYGLAGAALVWLSHPAIFFLAGVGLAVTYAHYVRGNTAILKYLFVIGGLWLAGFAAFYIVSLSKLAANEYLLNYWREGFPPSLTRPYDVVRWLLSSLLDMFDDPGGIATFGLAALLYVIGLISLFRRSRAAYFALLLPLLLLLLAAFLGKYPFTGRLILATLPLFMIPVAEGVDRTLTLLTAADYKLAIPILMIILFFFPVTRAISQFQEPLVKEEIRPVLEHVQDNWQKGDVIYLYYGAYYPFLYYQQRFGFEDDDYVLGIEAREHWVDYLPDLNRVRDYPRVWLVFSHVHEGNGINEEKLMVNWLDRSGAVQKEWFPRAGAASYLYQLNAGE